MHRPIFEIAKDIQNEWGDKVNYAASPYLEAMRFLSLTTDKYGCDSGTEILAYFLSNASSFRGEKARQLKSEIRDLLENY